MIVGSVVPVILLLILEWILWRRDFIDPMYSTYMVQREKKKKREMKVDITLVNQTNRFTQKVLGIGITVAGIIIMALGVIAEENRTVPIFIGFIIFVLGIYLLLKARK